MDDELIYFILLAKYMEIHHIDEEILVFPMNTFYVDTKTKIEILVDAINNNIKVSETEKFNNCIEGITYNKMDSI